MYFSQFLKGLVISEQFELSSFEIHFKSFHIKIAICIARKNSIQFFSCFAAFGWHVKWFKIVQSPPAIFSLANDVLVIRAY